MKVKTFGTGSNRVKVVLFPGHEFTPQHFSPRNLKHFRDVTERVSVVRHKSGAPSFFVKRRRLGSRTGVNPGAVLKTLEPISEAKLARFISSIAPSGITIEQPVAALLKPNGAHRVFYSFGEIELVPSFDFLSERHSDTFGKFMQRLRRHGINALDLVENLFYGPRNTLHVIDLEHWRVPEKLRRELGLKYYEVRVK